jgi:hypothetical protein
MSETILEVKNLKNIFPIKNDLLGRPIISVKSG